MRATSIGDSPQGALRKPAPDASDHQMPAHLERPVHISNKKSPPSNLKRRYSSFEHGKNNEISERAKRRNKAPAAARDNAASSCSSAAEVVSPRFATFKRHGNQYRDTKEDQYGRKPRHKTKADKYDLKIISTSRNKHEVETHRRRSKKRRKSGLVLNSEFKAPNAAQDRLTLKSHGGLGMFHNGKASSSVQRHGPPDLSFSEMNFLSRRELLTDVRSGRVNKSQKRDKGLSPNVTAYFAHPPFSKPETRLKADSTVSGRSSSIVSPISFTNSSPDKQPMTGAPRPPSLRRHKGMRNDNERQFSEDERPGAHHSKPRSAPAVGHPKADGAISHYSWSGTPSQQSRSPRDGPKPPRDSVAPARDLLKGGFGFNDQNKLKVNAKHTAHGNETPSHSTNKSCPSQMSLDQYTKSMLLGSKHGLWNRIPSQQPRSAELYTLSDLKNLAHLENFEADDKESTTFQEQHREQGAPLHHESSPGVCERQPVYQAIFKSYRTLCKSPPGESDFRRLSVPEKSVPANVSRSTNQSGLEIRENYSSDNPSSLRHLKLGSTRNTEPLTLTNPKASFTPAPHSIYPSLEVNQFDATPGGTSSITFDLSALQRHRRDALPEFRAYSHSPMDPAQQIICDIEQEERLGAWNETDAVGAIANEVDPISTPVHEQPMTEDNFNPHNDYDVMLPEGQEPVSQLGPEMAPLEETLGEEKAAEHRNRSSLAAPGKNGRHMYRPDQRLLVSSTRRVGGTSAADVSAQHDGEPSFIDFWRPHILY